MKRLQAVFFLSVFLCAADLPGYAAGSEDQNSYKAGISALVAGDSQRAVELLSLAIADRPQDYRYFNDRGVAYKRLGNLEMALADYNKAVSLNPGYTQALNNRGLVFLEQGSYDKAIADFSEALKHGGLQSKIYTNMGLARAKQGNHIAAIKDFDKAFSYRPLDYRSFVFMAESLEQTGEKERALKTYQLARGLIQETETKDVIEKRIAALEKVTPSSKTVPSVVSPDPGTFQQPASRNTSQPVHEIEKKAVPVREIARARPLSDITAPPRKNDQESLTTAVASLEALDRVSRTKATEKMATASAEIYRQGLQFLDKSDTTKALIRFEDTRQLERRNKNVFAVAWCDLEIGRIHAKLGDHTKAETFFGESFRLFESLKAVDHTILVLVELAANHQQAGRKEKASAFFSNARDRASSQGNQILASAIGDLAEGRMPEKPKQPVNPQRQGTGDSDPRKDQQSYEDAASKSAKQQSSVKSQQKPGGQSQKETPPQASSETGNERQGTVANQSKTQSETKPREIAPTERVKILRDPSRYFPSMAGHNPKTMVPSQPSRTIEKSSSEVRAIRASAPPNVDRSGHSGSLGVEASPAGKHGAVEKLASLRGTAGSGTSDPTDRDSYEKLQREDLALLRDLKKKNDEPQMIVVLERLSDRFIKHGKSDKALLALSAALAMRERLSLNKQIERTLLLRGNAQENLGHSAEALEDYSRAIALSELGDPRLAIVLEPRIKKLAASIGVDPQSILDTFKLLWKARVDGDSLGETQALFIIGRIYDKADRNTDALSYYDRSSASMTAHRARICEKMGKDKLAQEHYSQALETLKNLDYSGYISIMKRNTSAGNLSQH